MKGRYIKIILTFLTMLLFITPDYAQRFNPRSRYESFGFNVNATNYVGEVDPQPHILGPSLSHTRYNIGLTYLYRYSPRVSFRGNLSYGRIQGSDMKNASYNPNDIHRKIRNIDFRNQMVELKADVVVDMFANWSNFRRRVNYTPYAFMGIAYLFHTPQGRTASGDWVALQPLSTEGQGLPGYDKKPYSRHQIVIPFGVGFRYQLSQLWDVAFEIGWRYTFTDYLDDVGGTYADPMDLLTHKGELAVEMSDKTYASTQQDARLQEFVLERQGGYIYDDMGRPSVYGYGRKGDQRGEGNKDWYIITGIHLTYIFPGKVSCPKFR